MLVADGRWQGQHGIGRYSSEILRRLEIEPKLSSQRIGPASLLDPLWLSYQLRRLRASAFFSPGYNCAYRSNCRQILVLHDLIHLDIPEESSTAKSVYYERVVKPAILHAGSVITVSEFSRTRLAEWSGLARDCIAVAPGGLSETFQTLSSGAALHTRPYVLFVGNAKVHKRAAYVLDAASSFGAVDLVMVGNPNSDLAQVNSARERVRVIESVTDAELAILYRDARCLLMPSSYEGFGLPALEAMSQGTHVVYACDAVAEIVGDLGTRVSLDLPAQDFADVALAAGADDDAASLARRRSRAALFDWDETANRVSSVLALVDEPRSTH
jgi:glycosyltransferase involved in cell wall biosynthesis